MNRLQIVYLDGKIDEFRGTGEQIFQTPHADWVIQLDPDSKVFIPVTAYRKAVLSKVEE